MVKRRPGGKLDPAAAAIVAGYGAGASSKDLARRFGAAPLTVRSLLRRHGVPIRPAGKHDRLPGLCDRERRDYRTFRKNGFNRATALARVRAANAVRGQGKE